MISMIYAANERWVEDSAPLGGLNVEAPTIDELRDKIPAAVIDLLET
jgi:Domain of unknown function (DUF1902)